MEAILPFNTPDRDKLRDYLVDIGFDEFVALKFIFTMQDSDLDVFQVMGAERLSLLLYGWEICDQSLAKSSNANAAIPKKVQIVIRCLTQHSLDIWFSKEWEKCPAKLKVSLLFCLNRAKRLFPKIPELSLLNWEYLLRLDEKPWQVSYLDRFVEEPKKPQEVMMQSVEHTEEAASNEDVAYLQKEGLFVVLLRLIKMFDVGLMGKVKGLSMRIIAAWNHVYEQMRQDSDVAFPQVKQEHQRCLIFICHIYLMAIYETDDIHGFVIDNMINNIRFYYQSIQEKTANDDFSIEILEYTPARYIAMTCLNLRISSSDFINEFIFNTYDEFFTSLFGVISQAYMSYLLGNLLMEMNNMNEEDFNANLEKFKRIINLYVIERERSEMFMLREMRKQEMQRYCHNINVTVKDISDFKGKLCKGNRMSNIGNYEKTDDDAEEQKADEIIAEMKQAAAEKDRRMDPIFQNIPNNSNILNYVYNVLAKRKYKGWHFAKVVLLVKIICHELNVVETWRYHPGLTIDFMLSLEIKLSHHFEDLANIFMEHPFMEQEFWLTAFYLNPCDKYYETVIRCGSRYHRKRDEIIKPERCLFTVNEINAKYGLLSSTIDVQEIVRMANHDMPHIDYEPLYKALHLFRLPENIIKDLLTVTFLPRNKSFAWAVNWIELRKRCKILLKDNKHKKRFVELNMAEANDRLKFLKIDYEKYKHRPQLDYGSIEEGYESVVNLTDFDEDGDSSEGADFEESEEECDEEKRENKLEAKKFEEELFNSYFVGTRRTRARTAAVIASAMEDRKKRKTDEESNESSEDASKDAPTAAATETPTATETIESATAPILNPEPSAASAAIAAIKRDLKECLKERISYNNATSGFKPFPDIWNFNAQELQTVENSTVAHLETGNILDKFSQLKDFKVTSESRPLTAKATISLQCKNISTANTVPNSFNASLTAITKSDLSSAKCNEVKETDEVETKNASETAENIEEYNIIDGTNTQLKAPDLLGNLADMADEDNQMECDDTESLKSDISTIALKDCDEMNDSQKDEESDVCMNNDGIESYEDTKSIINSEVNTKEEKDANTEKQDQLLNENKQSVEQSTKETVTAIVENLHSNIPGAGKDAIIEETVIVKPTKKYKAAINIVDSVDTDDTDISMQYSDKSSEVKELIKECKRNQLSVSLHRLTVAECSLLRQPIVQLERIDYDEYVPKKDLIKRRRFHSKEHDDSDETCTSGSLYLDQHTAPKSTQDTTAATATISMGKRRVKPSIYQRYPYSSESSTESEEYKSVIRQPRATRGGASRGGIRASGINRNASRSKKLMVTPRSASGLKLRISSMTPEDITAITTASTATGASGSTSSAAALVLSQRQSMNKRTAIVDYIQISSSPSSSDSMNGSPVCLSPVPETLVTNATNMMEDPLYEEEIEIE